MVVMQENKSLKWPQYLATVVICIAASTIGIVLAWTSPTQSAITSGDYGFEVSTDQFSWISALVALGAAIMCVPAGVIVNKFGPKLTMLVLVIPFTVANVMLIWAQNVAMMCIARFILGMVAGAYCVSSPMYIAEIAEKQIRGTLGSYFQLMLTVGILLVYVLGSFVNAQWLTVICALFPLIFGAIFAFMPESPTFLVKKNKTGAAIESLQWLRGKDYDYSEELKEIQDTETKIRETQASFSEAFSRRSTIRALIIACGCMFFQQFGGVNAVIFYGADIFEKAQTGIDSNLSTIIVGIMQVVATFLSSLLIDKAGRRVLLLLSGLVMAVAAAALGTYFYLQETLDSLPAAVNYVPVVSLCFYIILFSIGFGPVPWLVMGELFASDVRSAGGACASTMNWICAFLVTKFFPNVQSALGAYTAFWIFAGINVLGLFFISFLVPETKGKSLQEIQNILEGKKSHSTHNEANKTTNQTV